MPHEGGDDHGPEEGGKVVHIPAFERVMNKFLGILDAPVSAVRELIVEPLQSSNKNKTYYYHRRYRRVPTVDECDYRDPLCIFEAQEQFKRDKQVDDQILIILRQRRMECEWYHGATDAPKYCAKLKEDYETAETNWFMKYGDLGFSKDVVNAYMKQKHRMLWERRHGPVGTGMKTAESEECH